MILYDLINIAHSVDSGNLDNKALLIACCEYILEYLKKESLKE